MAFHITTSEFSQTIQQALDTLHPNCDPEKPNLHLCPRLVSCDGPSLSVELEYDTKAWTSNPMGIVHGGVLALMLDNAMGLTCYCIYGHFTPTISMNLTYARPVALNETVRLRVTTLLAGGTTAQLQAQIYRPGQEERVLVSATGVYCSRTRS